MQDNIRVLVADDHALVRDGLCRLLAEHSALTVVGAAVDGKDFLHKAKRLRPDVALLDIAMPGLNGLDALPMLREAVPETRVVILSMYDKDAYVHQALSLGAIGYVLKTDSGREVVEAIQKAGAGHYFLSPRLNAGVIRKYLHPAPAQKSAPSGYDALSQREQQIFRLVVEGNTSKEIAGLLYLSPRTVEKHRSNIVRKLGIHDPAAMVRYAVKIGVVDPGLWGE